jgi:hypothetical protein
MAVVPTSGVVIEMIALRKVKRSGKPVGFLGVVVSLPPPSLQKMLLLI